MSYYCLSRELSKPLLVLNFLLNGEYMGKPPLRILVTGASRGIGREISKQLLNSGHKVAVTSRTFTELETTVAGYESSSLIIVADSTDTTSADSAINKVIEKWDGLDVLIVNAGDGTSAPIERTSNEIWDQSLAINLTAPFQYIRAAVPTMKAAKFGRIIVVASTAGLEGEANVSAYTAAKHGVVGLVRSAAAELLKYGITVNAVCPSYVDTPMTKRSLEAAATRTGKDFNQVRSALLAKIPGGRFLSVEEVAGEVIAFIDQPNVTGQAKIIRGDSK
jgi:NAD(P)-dependent dehydrogenase (short-subunit alcohol dehydrogenase family)